MFSHIMKILLFIVLAYSLEKDIKETNGKLMSIETDIDNFRSFLSDVTIDLKLKAYTGDLNRVERLLDTKYPLSSGIELANQVKLMAKAEELEKVKLELDYLYEKIEDQYFKKEEALVEFDKNHKKVVEMLENYSTKEYTNKISQKFYKKITKMNNEIEIITKKIQSLHEYFNDNLKDLKNELNLKVTQKDLDKVSQDVAGKATKNELSRYLGEINPKISAFQGEIGVFNRIVREQEQALLRLDEILLEKASKVETNNLYQKLASVSKHADLEYKIDEMLKNQRAVQEEFTDIQSDNRQIQLKFAEIQTHFSKKVNDGIELKFLKDLMLDMQTSISYKADRTEILNCLEQKAGWGDFSHLSQSLESVHRQIKLLAVQVGAIEKINAPKGKIRNSERSQREYFNKITNRLVNYVVNSKPTVDDPPLPEEIKAFLKMPGTPKVFDTIKTKNNTPHRRTHHSFDQLNNL